MCDYLCPLTKLLPMCPEAVAIRSLVLGLALAVGTGPGTAAELTGRVVSVHDGDSLTVLVDRRQVKVRLAEIDAPKLGQPFGRRSRESLAEMCAGKAAVVADQPNRYGLTIGRVACAGVDANAEQVRRGMAWVYDRYVTDHALYSIQDDALRARRGLWADPQPIPPWKWRLTNRKAKRSRQ